MIRYELTNTTDATIPESAIKSGLANASATLQLTDERFVSIEVVTPEQSREANKQLRGIDEPTDIISLSTNESAVGHQVIQEENGALSFVVEKHTQSQQTWPAIGQLIVCWDVIQRNAESAGQPPERELEWVIEHGVYHLMGYHHEHD